jgi:small-conductance mechanosensitive channel
LLLDLLDASTARAAFRSAGTSAATSPRPLEWMPEAVAAPVWGLAAWQWVGLVLAAAVAIVIGRAVTFVATKFAGRLAKRTEAEWDDELVVALRRPARFGVGVFAFDQLVRALDLPEWAQVSFARLFVIAAIGAAAWTLVGTVGVISRVVERRAQLTAGGADTLSARGIRTQVRVLARVANVAIAILATALMLTQFEIVRTIGVSLLASAGVAGVVLGFAAQRTIGSLIAGIQLSFTQPIRIGDVVIVEKEWGTIEEITLTFVVVRVWDERRLVVPMTRFLEQPFENWTKVSPALHGTVFFNADFGLPLDEVRRELDRIVVGHRLWDGRTKNVCVTNATERTIEVRALVSAANADNLWDLRVDLRERLIAWLRAYDDGRYLPLLRVDESPNRGEHEGSDDGGR